MLTMLLVTFSVVALTGQISGQPTPLAPMPSPTGLARPDLTGFWKVDCRENFGVKIEHADGDLYSLSFCGPGGCFEPGTWTPNSPVFGDTRYRVQGADTIQLPFGDGFITYHRCPSQGVETTGPEGGPKQEDLPPETTPSVHFKEYYQGLPDLDKDPPFAKQTPEQAAALRALVLRQQHKPKPCPTDQAPVPGVNEICGASAAAARAILQGMNRGLDGQHLSHVWLADFDPGTERGLVVQYDKTVSEGPSADRYAAFFFFQWEGQTYGVTAAAWFLEGSLQAVRPFGPRGSRKAFLRFLSCTECHAWVYVTVFDPLVPPVGAVFDFSYNGGVPDSWEPEIEYELPGMGHSIEAKVETRLPERPTALGPHLLQHFAVEDGEDEWWSFTCRDLRCSPDVVRGKPPQSFLAHWKRAKRL